MHEQANTVPGTLEALSHLLDMGPAERILCEHRGSSVTLGRLRESRDTCAAAMEKAGVGAGDAVVAVLGSKPNTIAAMFAAWSIGAAFAPLDPHMSPYLARRFLDTVVPTVVLAGDEPAPVLPDGAGVVQPAGDDHLDWDVDSSASAGTPRPQVTALPKSEVALDLGVIDTAGGVVAISVPAADLGRTVSTIPDDLGGDCRIGTFSLDTWAGIVDVLTAVRGNHRLVLCSPFSPSEFRKSVKRHSARTASLTTQSMAMLLEDPDAEDLEPLETIRFASAHLPIPLVRRFHRQFGVNVAAGYGNRQFGREVLGWDATDLRRHGSGKVGSTGRPRPGVEVALVDDSGAPLPEGRVGELTISVASELAVRTGRHAWVDPEGFVWIVGRTEDTVEIASKRVFPESVEAVLIEHPDIRDVAVFGVAAGTTGGTDTTLWGVLRPAPRSRREPEDLVRDVLGMARSRLTRAEIPSRFAVLDVLPKVEAGLPDRDALAVQASAGALPAVTVTA